MKMKKVNWIIDKYIFDDYEKKLETAIKNSGHNVLFYDDTVFENLMDFFNKKFKWDQNETIPNPIVIFHGSLECAKQFNNLIFYPGAYLTLSNYECFKYYGLFGDNLLNSNYFMMGLNDVLRNKNKFFDTFKTDGIFIRPSDGFKSFPGQTLPKENFDFEFNIFLQSYGGLDTDTLVVISAIQDIEEEYRFIVIDDVVVSGSLYMDKNNRDSHCAYYDKLCTDQSAWDFAVEMSKIYQPDKAYVIDVCKLSNGEYKMIELNSFCCGSMYGNDYDKVVEAVNNLCIKDFEDVYE